MADFHVYPVNDLIDHELVDDCPCLPESMPVPRDDGSMGWLMIHSALDGRENREADRSHRH